MSEVVTEELRALARQRVAIKAAAADAVDEAFRAIQRFPPFNSTHEGYAVVLEELDEAWADIKGNDRNAAVAEMVQVAAMALRFIAEFNEPSLREGLEIRG